MLSNDEMYQLFTIRNNQNKLRLQALYRPDLVSHITRLQDGVVCFTSDRTNCVSNIVQPAEELVKTIMTTGVCVSNPSMYKNFDFTKISKYFVTIAQERGGYNL